jgi:uncharacterized protein YjeT (DUF2065 family)
LGAKLELVSAEEIAAGIQFVVDGQGHVTSVVVEPAVWKKLVAQLEDAEDRRLLQELAPRLATGPANALRWADVEHEWA